MREWASLESRNSVVREPMPEVDVEHEPIRAVIPLMAVALLTTESTAKMTLGAVSNSVALNPPIDVNEVPLPSVHGSPNLHMRYGVNVSEGSTSVAVAVRYSSPATTHSGLHPGPSGNQYHGQ